MTLPQLDVVSGRIGDPLAITLNFWQDAGKTTPWNLTQIGTSWLAELRYDPDQLNPSATFAIDSSNAATGVLVLTLDADDTAALKAIQYGFDVKEISSDTTLVTGWYKPSPRYTHDTGGASPATSTPVWEGNVILLGDASGSLTVVSLFTGPQGQAGPAGAPGAPVVAHDAARPSTTSPVIFTGGTSGTPPAAAISGDFWIHS